MTYSVWLVTGETVQYEYDLEFRKFWPLPLIVPHQFVPKDLAFTLDKGRKNTYDTNPMLHYGNLFKSDEFFHGNLW